MKVRFDIQLMDLDGQIINDVKGNPATVGGVIIDALLANYVDEKDLSGTDKLARWSIAKQIKSDIDVNITVEDLALIKKLVGKAYGPLVVGQVYTVLEGE